MKPILFQSNETEFCTNGFGLLSDATACTATEERNGMFELEMQYPVSGLHFAEIKARRILLAAANPTDALQPFRIYRITKPLRGVVTVYAQHISYDLAGVPISPFSAASAPEALQKLSDCAAIESPFEFWTDKSTAAHMMVSVPSSTRALLGGQTGSILDTYGGEYKFDRYLVRLYGQRGENRGVSIRYGKNLTDLEQDENIASVYTGVYPYWADANGNLVSLPEKILNAAGTYDFVHIMPLDLSQEWQDAPSETALRNRAQSYMDANSIGVPKVSLTVSFVQLEQTEEYKGLGIMERVALCDTVNVEFPTLGVSATAKCVKTVYNVLLDRFDSVELGESRSSIANTIAEQQQAVKEKPSKTFLQQAIDSVTSTILGAKGGSVRLLDENGDGEPDTLYIADNPIPAQAVKVWRFNYEGWGASSHGYNGPFTVGASLDTGIVADFITAGVLRAGLIKSGILQSVDGKTFFLDLENGILRLNATELTIKGKTAEQIAAEKAADAEKAANAATTAAIENYASTVTSDMAELQKQIDGQITTWFYDYDPAPDKEPSASWDVESEKESHAGDLFYNTEKGYAYRWALDNEQWTWLPIVDTDVVKALADAKAAQDTADGKRRTFITQPAPPYDTGDIWARGSAGELLVCATTKASGAAFSAADWVSAADYTAQAATAGRNLASNTANIGRKNSSLVTFNGTEFECTPTATGGASVQFPITDYGISAMQGKSVVLSFEYKTVEAITWLDENMGGMQGRIYITYKDGTSGFICAPTGWREMETATMTEYKTVSRATVIPNKPIKSAYANTFVQCASGKVSFKNVKVEIGTAETPWSAAPEDTAISENPADVLTQEQVFNLLTKNGTMQGIYMKDNKLYINAQYIATGKLASTDGKSYFDLANGIANLKGSFSTEPITNSIGTYRVNFESGKIALQRMDGTTWKDEGFIAWNVAVTPAEAWIKGSRIDATQSIDTPGVWITNGGQMLGATNGRRFVNTEDINMTGKFCPRTGQNALNLDWVLVNKADGGTAWALCGL